MIRISVVRMPSRALCWYMPSALMLKMITSAKVSEDRYALSARNWPLPSENHSADATLADASNISSSRSSRMNAILET